MAILTLNTNTSGSASRVIINDNFTDLDTTKADLDSPTFTGTPTLPSGTTGVTQPASDNSTKLATTAYVDNQVTLGGVIAKTLIPRPVVPETVNTGVSMTVAGNTTMFIAQFNFFYTITINKISFITTSGTKTDGAFNLSLYSQDGSTRLFSETTATITSAGLYTHQMSSPVTVPAGIYYFGINARSTASYIWAAWSNATNAPWTTGATSLAYDVASKPILQGTLTITADTPPTTINPTSITKQAVAALMIRLDN